MPGIKKGGGSSSPGFAGSSSRDSVSASAKITVQLLAQVQVLEGVMPCAAGLRQSMAIQIKQHRLRAGVVLSLAAQPH
ncbi:hypothetical protein CSQ89_11770 [Chitinimonas sp. BJB300]|nr:hypothetical protein CSQ89_11770 [Chitinimonas sp. BJB300]